MDASTGQPADYEELFNLYFPMMRGVVARSGIRPSDVEDVAMDILARFIQTDGISYFDSDYGKGAERYRKPTFRGMLRGYTSTYVLQYRDKQMIRDRIEPWRLEHTTGPEEDAETWLQATYGETADPTDLIGRVEATDTLRRVLLDARRRLGRTEKRDYHRFIELLVEQGLLDGKIARKHIAAELGVSITTVSVMLVEVREVLAPLVEGASLSEAG